jgi:hypothetical protein
MQKNQKGVPEKATTSCPMMDSLVVGWKTAMPWRNFIPHKNM